MEPTTIEGILTLLRKGVHLSSNQISLALRMLSSKEATSAQMSTFLMRLAEREESEEELLGAAQFLRSQMISLPLPADCVDIVGTGGDGHHTYNISTAAAFVAAGAGAKVAKHGNKSSTSLSGSSDVLHALGIKIDISPQRSLEILKDLGICFLWAQSHHPIMKLWGPIRSELGIRTIFNLVGPLCNPGNIRRLLVGVYHQKWVKPFTNVLRSLGCDHAWIVHGHDGLDELSTTGPSTVNEIKGDQIFQFEVKPEDIAIQRTDLINLRGGEPKTNADEMKNLLKGKQCPYRDIVLLNAGALLVVAGLADNLKKGVEHAAHSIDKGQALDKLNQLIDKTQS